MRGKIVSWNDERGFGFIQPEDRSEQVFFHISSVKKAERRPQTGDTVEFDCARDGSGRLKARAVLIENVALQKPRSPRRTTDKRNPLGELLIAASLLVVLIGGWLLTQGRLPLPFGRSDNPVLHSEAPLQSELDKTLALIDRGGPFPHRQDGSVFQNRERQLPAQPRGYYHEYTVRTPGLSNRGPRRIITGGNPPVIFYYTEDHYRTFRILEKRP